MLKIIKGIFGVDPTDLLPGLAKGKNPLEGGMFPDLTPKMMIGEGGLKNLEAAGMRQGLSSEDLAMAQFDLQSLGKEGLEKNTDWITKGIEIDPIAEKVMYEIPDDEVRLLKGRKLENLDGQFGFSELFKADLLTNAYPELTDLKINIINEPKSNSAGTFNPVKNVLTLNRGHDYVKGDIKKTLLHEIQHFVQEKENFTRGEQFALRLSEEPDYNAGVEAMQKAIGSKYVTDGLAKMLTDAQGLNLNARNVEKAMMDIVNNPGMDTKKILEQSFQSKEMADKFLSRAKQYPALVGFLESKDLADMGYVQAFNKYQRVAGEQYANATAERGGMNQAQRMQRRIRADLLAPDDMLPSSMAERLAAKQGMQDQQFTDPMQSSIQSSIPQGL